MNTLWDTLAVFFQNEYGCILVLILWIGLLLVLSGLLGRIAVWNRKLKDWLRDDERRW